MSDMPMFIHADESLREQLALVGVSEIKRWACPCQRPGCQTYVLFGIGTAISYDVEGVSGTTPTGSLVLFVVCSFSFNPEPYLRVMGIDATEDVDALLAHWFEGPEYHQRQASLLAFLCTLGLRAELDAELAAMRSRARLS